MEEKIKDLLEKYEEKLNYHKNLIEEYKKGEREINGYLRHHQNMFLLYTGAIMATERLLP